MALFGSKKNINPPKTFSKKEKVLAGKVKTAVAKKEIKPVPAGASLGVLLRPRITEKAAFKSESGVYTFDVALDATKRTVAQAIEAMYKVMPTKVAMVTVPAKTVFVRGKKGMNPKGKKAYVFLKKGERIEFV